jgi:hypothetical protein
MASPTVPPSILIADTNKETNNNAILWSPPHTVQKACNSL